MQQFYVIFNLENGSYLECYRGMECKWTKNISEAYTLYEKDAVLHDYIIEFLEGSYLEIKHISVFNGDDYVG